MLGNIFHFTDLRARRKDIGLAITLLAFFYNVNSDASPPPPYHLRTNEAVYQNPFDLAAGGASLTRATQDGVLFANPSLSAFGPGLLRWIFFRTGLHFGSDAADLIYKAVKNRNMKLDSELANKALKTPIFLGLDLSGGLVTSYGGAGAFASVRMDASMRQFGSEGIPEMRIRTSAYGGGIASAAYDISDYFAVGSALRYQANAEVYKSIGLLELTQGKQFLENAKKSYSLGFGTSLDVGGTFQIRTKHIDFRAASTINDVGDTKFSSSLPSWKETINFGMGVTLHNRGDALHCSVDERDLLAKYHEHWTRRNYAGCKAIFRSRFGFAAGLYQGWPAYGAILNLSLVRLELGSYTKEMGSEVNTEARRIYFVAFGAEVP